MVVQDGGGGGSAGAPKTSYQNVEFSFVFGPNGPDARVAGNRQHNRTAIVVESE